MTKRERARLIRERQVHLDKIDAAYWIFARTARGRPPVLAVPESYRRVQEINAVLKEGRREPRG